MIWKRGAGGWGEGGVGGREGGRELEGCKFIKFVFFFFQAFFFSFFFFRFLFPENFTQKGPIVES